MENNTNQVSSTQAPIPNGCCSNSIVENKQVGTKLVKPLLIALIAVVFLATNAFGYRYFLSSKENKNTSQENIPTQTQPTQQVHPTSVPTTVATPANMTTDRVYRNEKYNFQFSYPQDRYYGGKLASSYKIEEIGAQIIITETVYRSGGDKEDILSIYKLYDANFSDKDNLIAWWQQNIKSEIGNHRIPTDYNTLLNSVPFDNCIAEFGKTWVLPPSLEVTLKEGVEAPGPYKGSIYFYYDFGKPFIMNFTEESTGACGDKDSYLVFTSMSKLR
jgi:hypothetical protein